MKMCTSTRHQASLLEPTLRTNDSCENSWSLYMGSNKLQSLGVVLFRVLYCHLVLMSLTMTSAFIIDYRRTANIVFFLAIHVDNILVICNVTSTVNESKDMLSKIVLKLRIRDQLTVVNFLERTILEGSFDLRLDDEQLSKSSRLKRERAGSLSILRSLRK